MEHLTGEYYIDKDPRHWQLVLYYWKDANAGETRPSPIELDRFHMQTDIPDLLQAAYQHSSKLREYAEEERLKEEREGLTRYVAYLTPMQVSVLKAMEAKFEEEEE